MKKLLILFFVFLILILPVIAVPPFQTSTGAVGIDIRTPAFDVLRVNTDYKTHFHIFNKSDGLAIVDGVNCTLHLYNQTADHILTEDIYTFDDDYDLEVNVSGDLISTIGVYSFIFQCNKSDIGGFVSGGIEVTETGFPKEEIGAGLPIIIFVLLITGFIFFIPFYIKFSENEFVNLMIKRGCWLVAIYLMVINSAIIATISMNTHLLLEREMFLYMWMFGWAGYVGMIILCFKTIFDMMEMWKEKRHRDRFGDDD